MSDTSFHLQEFILKQLDTDLQIFYETFDQTKTTEVLQQNLDRDGVLPLTESQGQKPNEEQQRRDLNQELQRQDQVKHETEQRPDRHSWWKTQISCHSKTSGSRRSRPALAN
jgi:uncharacterized glyoxalase superfamily metalloenzyme YdcJ